MKNLERIIPRLITIELNTAVCFVALGWALIIKSGQQRKSTNIIYRILLLLVSLIGGITLLEYQLHFDAHIDQLFITDHRSVTIRFPFPGRMAYHTAVSFILLGSGLLGLSTRYSKFCVIFQYLLHAVTVISGTVILGYIYGVSMLYHLWYVGPMAVQTAMLLLLLSIAAALLNPGLGIARLFTGSRTGDRIARRYFTILMLVLVFVGSLQHFHILPPEISISLFAIGLLVTSVVMIWTMANRL